MLRVYIAFIEGNLHVSDTCKLINFQWFAPRRGAGSYMLYKHATCVPTSQKDTLQACPFQKYTSGASVLLIIKTNEVNCRIKFSTNKWYTIWWKFFENSVVNNRTFRPYHTDHSQLKWNNHKFTNWKY